MRETLRILSLASLLIGPAAAQSSKSEETPSVLSGIDVLQERDFRELKGKRIGVITNQTGIDSKGHSTLKILANASGVTLSAVFSPEHGFTGVSEDEEVDSGSYALPDGNRIPLFSLYGGTRAPTADMLKGLDALVFDIQDIGARFYTYATTMAMAMESAAKLQVEFVVLDRPNPITGEIVEGAVREAAFASFISYFPIPVRHGLTLGEIARLHNLEARLGARLHVVPMKGWRRGMWFDETGLPWIRPSPNMPDLDAATLYPGIACFEASNISVGRGTELPFRWIGAPWMDAPELLKRMRAAKLPGVEFSVMRSTPTKSVFADQECAGIRMRITDRTVLRPLQVFVHLAGALRDIHPEDFKLDFERLPRFTGTAKFNELHKTKAPPEETMALFDAEAEGFKTQRTPFLLY